jgi:hypothetical protein
MGLHGLFQDSFTLLYRWCFLVFVYSTAVGYVVWKWRKTASDEQRRTAYRREGFHSGDYEDLCLLAYNAV